MGPEASVVHTNERQLIADLIPITILVMGFGYRPHFENFTVDASIFVVINKLLRAIGGCLGTKSR